MPRLMPLRASGIVEEELKRLGLYYDSSTAPAHDRLRTEARSLDWWLATGRVEEDRRSDRNRALLHAYLRIASGDSGDAPGKLYADGLRLDRGKSLHMDRSVMARLLAQGLVTFNDEKSDAPYFELTEAGRQFVEEG
ncbi:MAG TPA: hypothetical protein VEX35_01275 [Allosphingosinicella sp.]|nr:hypothetical protein [Allosphingosinicella sp.]